jgi:hypothetical protein
MDYMTREQLTTAGDDRDGLQGMLDVLTREGSEVDEVDPSFEKIWEEGERSFGVVTQGGEEVAVMLWCGGFQTRLPASPTSLEGLVDAINCHNPWLARHFGIDWSSLPTFGGETPKDLTGIWSWDESRLLVGSSHRDLEIVPRGI